MINVPAARLLTRGALPLLGILARLLFGLGASGCSRRGLRRPLPRAISLWFRCCLTIVTSLTASSFGHVVLLPFLVFSRFILHIFPL